jgi:SAM-dependent methyltransferase
MTEDEHKRARPGGGFGDAARWYDANVDQLSQSYESVTAEHVHAWLIPSLPAAPSLILDVGSGTGRDAQWFATRGHKVVAVEPSTEMRQRAQRLHTSDRIQWLDDRLPALEKVHKLGVAFDLILLSAVWMHVPPSERSRAFRKLVTLLKPGGCIAITLRHGPVEAERQQYDVSLSEIEALARNHGAFVERAVVTKDELGRSSVKWTQIAIRQPDDGTGALPLLRHIILNDDKAATYKLALLRTVCRIADGSPGLARSAGDNHVSLPFGLVSLYWLRLYWPLLNADLPQRPNNRGFDGLGFVKDGVRGLVGLSSMDLRMGVQFGGDRARALHRAILQTCRHIERMPANFMTYPDGNSIMIVKSRRSVATPDVVHLNEAYLSSFGEMQVPVHLWRAFQRLDVWIEPSLIAEWTRLIHSYAHRQGRALDDAHIAKAMTWSEPSRDVQTARFQALRLLEQGKLHCVWTGQSLSIDNLDIDHCIPWSAWPCEDLWNLVPANRTINQREKRDRLPSREMLRSARDRMQDWWGEGYLGSADPQLRDRFSIEARSSLPTLEQIELHLDEISDGIELLQTRLEHDQKIPVWGTRS